jgi:hypothetical protein
VPPSADRSITEPEMRHITFPALARRRRGAAVENAAIAAP